MALDHIRQSPGLDVAEGGSIHVARTSLGYKFSIREGLGATTQCSVSREGRLISLATVRTLARLIGHLDGTVTFVHCHPGSRGSVPYIVRYAHHTYTISCATAQI
jgi:hypothetical protein